MGSLLAWKSLFTKRRTREDCGGGRSQLVGVGLRDGELKREIVGGFGRARVWFV